MRVINDQRAQGSTVSNRLTVSYGQIGRGIFANRSIADGTTVVKIPRDNAITMEHILSKGLKKSVILKVRY